MSGVLEKCGAWTLGREIDSSAYGVVYWATGPQGAPADRERYERGLQGARL